MIMGGETKDDQVMIPVNILLTESGVRNIDMLSRNTTYRLTQDLVIQRGHWEMINENALSR